MNSLVSWLHSHRRTSWFCLTAAVILIPGFLLPGNAAIPVQGATSRDWNAKSFWYEPWGVSGVHKGIDIFAPQGRPVISATPGIVIFQGHLRLGGHVVAVLGPRWRIHYYAHLADNRPIPRIVHTGDVLGGVGNSGNAQGKPPHLHYSIISLIPLPWHFSMKTQGWKQMFFLNPEEVFLSSQ